MLRASNNRLTDFHASNFTHLRTLYLDSNRLREIYELDKLSKLDNLSLRNQVGGHSAQ
jgi:Leucine-rich repeat (LRR) protein